MLKEQYERAELKVNAFSAVDVILTSGRSVNDFYEGWNPYSAGGKAGYEGWNPFQNQ